MLVVCVILFNKLSSFTTFLNHTQIHIFQYIVYENVVNCKQSFDAMLKHLPSPSETLSVHFDFIHE